jgi:cell division protein FtsX
MYGVISAFLATVLFYPVLFWLNPPMENLFLMDVLSYYSSHILMFFSVSLLVGILFGIISSALAVRKYLEI